MSTHDVEWNYPNKRRDSSPAVRRARLAEEIGWALRDDEAQIAHLTGLLKAATKRIGELEGTIDWHLQFCKCSSSEIDATRKRADLGKGGKP